MASDLSSVDDILLQPSKNTVRAVGKFCPKPKSKPKNHVSIPVKDASSFLPPHSSSSSMLQPCSESLYKEDHAGSNDSGPEISGVETCKLEAYDGVLHPGTASEALHSDHGTLLSSIGGSEVHVESSCMESVDDILLQPKATVAQAVRKFQPKHISRPKSKKVVELCGPPVTADEVKSPADPPPLLSQTGGLEEGLTSSTSISSCSAELLSIHSGNLVEPSSQHLEAQVVVNLTEKPLSSVVSNAYVDLLKDHVSSRSETAAISCSLNCDGISVSEVPSEPVNKSLGDPSILLKANEEIITPLDDLHLLPSDIEGSEDGLSPCSNSPNGSSDLIVAQREPSSQLAPQKYAELIDFECSKSLNYDANENLNMNNGNLMKEVCPRVVDSSTQQDGADHVDAKNLTAMYSGRNEMLQINSSKFGEPAPMLTSELSSVDEIILKPMRATVRVVKFRPKAKAPTATLKSSAAVPHKDLQAFVPTAGIKSNSENIISSTCDPHSMSSPIKGLEGKSASPNTPISVSPGHLTYNTCRSTLVNTSSQHVQDTDEHIDVGKLEAAKVLAESANLDSVDDVHCHCTTNTELNSYSPILTQQSDMSETSHVEAAMPESDGTVQSVPETSRSETIECRSSKSSIASEETAGKTLMNVRGSGSGNAPMQLRKGKKLRGPVDGLDDGSHGTEEISTNSMIDDDNESHRDDDGEDTRKKRKASRKEASTTTEGPAAEAEKPNKRRGCRRDSDGADPAGKSSNRNSEDNNDCDKDYDGGHTRKKRKAQRKEEFAAIEGHAVEADKLSKRHGHRRSSTGADRADGRCMRDSEDDNESNKDFDGEDARKKSKASWNEASTETKGPAVEADKPSKRRRRKRDYDGADPVTGEPAKKKFSHSTRRNRRTVSKELLETPEEDIDPKKLKLRDLIILADIKERRLNREAESSKKSFQSASVDEAIPNDIPYDDEDPLAATEEPYMESDQANIPFDASERLVNYHSFMNKSPSERWSKSDTQKFYQALQKFGTDFGIIQQLFPGRTRHQVKLKYKAEERKHPLQVADALIHRSKDHSHFELVIERIRQAQAEQDANREEELHDVDSEHEESGQAVEGAMKMEGDMHSPTKSNVGQDAYDWNDYGTSDAYPYSEYSEYTEDTEKYDYSIL